jgi:Protein of unknown function (DUF3176)
LSRFDRQPQPEFASQLTLNALVQLITTAGTLLVSMALSAALSQIAWLVYYSNDRPLLDFEMHQRASPGGIGSLLLLYYLKFSLRWFEFLLRTAPEPTDHRQADAVVVCRLIGLQLPQFADYSTNYHDHNLDCPK